MHLAHYNHSYKKTVVYSGLSLLLLAIILPYVLAGIHIYKHYLVTDFALFQGSAYQILQQQPEQMYSDVISTPFTQMQHNKNVSYHPANLSANLNPPILNVLFTPLATLDYLPAFVLFSILSFICFSYSLYLLWHTFFNKHYESLLLLGLGSLCLLVVYQNFIAGQLGFILMALVLSSWSAGRKQQDIRSGIALGLACTIKLFPGLFLLSLLRLKRYKLVSIAITVFILSNLLTLLALGYDVHTHYLNALQSIDWYAMNWNASLLGWLIRLSYQATPITFLQLPLVIKVIYYFLASCAIALLFSFTRTVSDNHKDTWDRVYAITIIFMLLLSPLGWSYYCALLLLPIILVIRFIINQDLPTVPTFTLSLALFLMNFPKTLEHVHTTSYSTLQSIFAYSFDCYALLTFSALICYIHYHEQKTRTQKLYRTKNTGWGLLIPISLAIIPSIHAIFRTSLIFKGTLI